MQEMIEFMLVVEQDQALAVINFKYKMVVLQFLVLPMIQGQINYILLNQEIHQ